MNKFFKCNECKKVFLDLSRNENPTGLVELKANTVDASNEKHIPDVHVEGDKVNVVVGSVIHPMTIEHHIEWIGIVTSKGIRIDYLDPPSEPKATFTMEKDEVLKEVYSYCNLHGLWMKSF